MHKSIFLCLNSSVSPAEVQRLQTAGRTVQIIRRFGQAITPLNVPAEIKSLIRQGRVVWIHGVIKRVHWQKPTWTTQCCRLAHRAGAQWSLWFDARPWEVKPFEMLRRHKYVQTHSSDGSKGVWLASEGVKLRNGCDSDIVGQAIECKAGSGPQQNTWIDEFGNSFGEQTKRQARAAEDAAAIGGLRTPHKAVAKWPTAPLHSSWLVNMIDSLPNVDAPEVTARWPPWARTTYHSRWLSWR